MWSGWPAHLLAEQVVFFVSDLTFSDVHSDNLEGNQVDQCTVSSLYSYALFIFDGSQSDLARCELQTRRICVVVTSADDIDLPPASLTSIMISRLTLSLRRAGREQQVGTSTGWMETDGWTTTQHVSTLHSNTILSTDSAHLELLPIKWGLAFMQKLQSANNLSVRSSDTAYVLCVYYMDFIP